MGELKNWYWCVCLYLYLSTYNYVVLVYSLIIIKILFQWNYLYCIVCLWTMIYRTIISIIFFFECMLYIKKNFMSWQAFSFHRDILVFSLGRKVIEYLLVSMETCNLNSITVLPRLSQPLFSINDETSCIFLYR